MTPHKPKTRKWSMWAVVLEDFYMDGVFTSHDDAVAYRDANNSTAKVRRATVTITRSKPKGRAKK